MLELFEKFITPLNREQGREIFPSLVSPEALLERSRGEHVVLVGRKGRALVGMIELPD